MKPVIIHRSARKELDGAIAHYESIRTGLGLDLQDEVEHAVSRLQADPQLGPRYKATEYRFWLIRRFPYVVYYLELDEFIWVAAVAHGRRRPGYWTRRRMK